MNCIHIYGSRYGLFSEFQWPIVGFLPNVYLNAHHRNNKNISFTPGPFLHVSDRAHQQPCHRGESATLSAVSPICLFTPPCTYHLGHQHILWLLCLRIFQIDATCPVATILVHHFWSAIFGYSLATLPFRHSYNAYLETTHFHMQCLRGFSLYPTQQNQEFVSWPTSHFYVTVSLLFLLLTGSSTHPNTHILIHLLSLHLPIHHPSIHPHRLTAVHSKSFLFSLH